MLWIPAWIERMTPGLAGMTVVMRKEMLAQQRQFRGWWLLPRMAFLLVFLAFILIAVGALNYYLPTDLETIDNFVLSAIGFILNILVIALVLPQTAGAIAHERETGALDLLLLTPLSTGEILAGKLLAPVAPLLLLMLPAVPLLLIARLLQWSNPLLPLIPLLSAIVSLVSFAAIGLCCSTLFNNTGRAIGVAIAVIILGLYSPLAYLSMLLVPVMMPVLLAAGLTAAIRRLSPGKRLTILPGYPWLTFSILTAIFIAIEILAVYRLYLRVVVSNSVLSMILLSIIGLITVLCYGCLALYLARRRLEQLRRVT